MPTANRRALGAILRLVARSTLLALVMVQLVWPVTAGVADDAHPSAEVVNLTAEIGPGGKVDVYKVPDGRRLVIRDVTGYTDPKSTDTREGS